MNNHNQQILYELALEVALDVIYLQPPTYLVPEHISKISREKLDIADEMCSQELYFVMQITRDMLACRSSASVSSKISNYPIDKSRHYFVNNIGEGII